MPSAVYSVEELRRTKMQRKGKLPFLLCFTNKLATRLSPALKLGLLPSVSTPRGFLNWTRALLTAKRLTAFCQLIILSLFLIQYKFPSRTYYDLYWRREWQLTPVLLPGESHGQRSLVGYSPWGGKELDMTGQLSTHLLSFLSGREAIGIMKMLP